MYRLYRSPKPYNRVPMETDTSLNGKASGPHRFQYPFPIVLGLPSELCKKLTLFLMDTSEPVVNLAEVAIRTHRA
jgi:hypothetical protein